MYPETCRLRRFFAALLDGIFCGIVNFTIGGLSMFSALKSGQLSQEAIQQMKHADPNNMTQALGPLWATVVILQVVILLYSSFEIFFAGSLGKLLLGIRIRREDGEIADIGTLILRWVMKYSSNILGVIAVITGVSGLHLAGGLIGLVFGLGILLIFGSSSQTLHDRLAGTCVYRAGDLPSPVIPVQSVNPNRPANAPNPNDLFKPRW